MRGHVLVGADARSLRASDELVVRDVNGQRFCRCLRCLAWLEVSAADPPTRDYPPDRYQIMVPVRGRALRDRWVLRLIAIDKALHAVLLFAVAVGVWIVAGHQDATRNTFLRLLIVINGGNPDQSTTPALHLGAITSRVDWVLRLNTSTLHAASAGIAGYAALNATEAFGLWHARRWAEYLSAVATSVFIPIELYELAHHATIFKAGTLAANVLIVAYLVYAKRLFGVRGGGRAEQALRIRECSIDAIEQAASAYQPNAAGAIGRDRDAGALDAAAAGGHDPGVSDRIAGDAKQAGP
jgi:uncharacterized membrane protein (DUF2068 family)